MAAVWRVEVLGGLRAIRDDDPVSRFRTRRVGFLLAYLAFHRGRSLSRSEVGEMLWPEGEPEAIGRNLRQALSSLRHVLEPPPLPAGSVLQVQRASLALNPEAVATDVAEFESALAEARRAPLQERETWLRRAVDLYKGELLPGLDEDWVVQERFRLEDLYVSALRRLAETDDVDEAIQAWRLALVKEPLQEEGHLALMRLYLESGRPASAVQQFQELKDRLWEELGEEPGVEAVRLFEEASVAAPLTLPSPSLGGEGSRSGSPRSAPERRGEGSETPLTPAPLPQRGEGFQKEPTVRLPILLNRFRGREGEMRGALAQITEHEARLTTLMGPAGTGKTRLSVEVGRRLAGEGWSVWFVPLADLSDASMVPDAVLDAMKIRREPGQDALEALHGATREFEKRLLILDNLEHILEGVLPFIERLIAEVTGVRLMTTSRQALRLEAEHRVPLQPLPFPAPGEVGELAGWIESPSVQLFIDRCQTVRPDFQLTAHNARAVLDICAKLEGIPLAIELAAALSGSFAPSQMAAHLETRRMTLSSRRRDLPDRHRSLHAAIEYSYVTLSPEMQGFFARLSVFRGGFTVEAACTVAGEEGLSREVCFDRLLELQERSLLQTSPSDEGGAVRFRMLETFREFGGEQLSDEETWEVQIVHARFMLDSTVAPAGTLTPEARTAHHFALEAEFDNGIAALETLLRAGDLEGCFRLLQQFSFAWNQRGPRAIEQKLIRAVAEHAGELSPVSRIGLLRMLGTTHLRALDYAGAYRACQTALGVAEENGLEEQVAVCYSAIATCAGFMGRLDECLEMNQLALAHTPASNLALQERSHLGIGAVHWGRGELREAEASYLRAVELSVAWRGEPDPHLLRNLARVCLDEGRFDEAMVRLGEAMRISRRLHDDAGLGMGLSLISRYHWLRGNLDAALSIGQEALVKFRQADFSHWSLLGLQQQALILTATEQWEIATVLLGATVEIGNSGRTMDDKDRETALAKIRSQLSTAAFERAWAKGLAMNTGEAFDLALR